MIAISVENLTKVFPAGRGLSPFFFSKRSNRVEVLQGVSLEVREGEVFGLLGPNGGGKTTFLEILATYLLPTSGDARVKGYDVVKESLLVRRHTGYCPAGGRGLDSRLSGKQNLQFFALISRLSKNHSRERIAHLWKLVGLDQFKDVPVARYSDGMRKRLALAKALLTDPPILLLDEPTQGLDPEASLFWNRFLRDQLVGKMGKTILLVSHNLIELQNICDRVAVMDRGKIVAEGGVAEVLKKGGISPPGSNTSPKRGELDAPAGMPPKIL